MANIELVIKIPEGLKKDFELEQWTALSCMEMKNALMNGTPLQQNEVRQKMYYYLNGVADGLHESRRDTIDVLDKIRAEIERKCCITVGRENDGAITLHDVFEIIDKYKAESEEVC